MTLQYRDYTFRRLRRQVRPVRLARSSAPMVMQERPPVPVGFISASEYEIVLRFRDAQRRIDAERACDRATRNLTDDEYRGIIFHLILGRPLVDADFRELFDAAKKGGYGK